MKKKPMNKKTKSLYFLTFGIIFNLGAFTLTNYGLSLPGIEELNPIMAYIQKHGPIATILILALDYCLLYKMAWHYPKPTVYMFFSTILFTDFILDALLLANL